MARKPGTHFTGAVYHVMLHGNGGQTIFFDFRDYSVFEQLVAEDVERFNHQIYAYGRVSQVAVFFSKDVSTLSRPGSLIC